MKKFKLELWIQLIGMLSVVFGLLFVGAEMRQSQRIAIATQEQARSEQVTDQLLALMDGAWRDMYQITSKPYSELSEEQKYLRSIHRDWATQMQQNTLYQYNQGFISESEWKVIQARIAQSWEACELRETYDFRFIEEEFAQYLRTLPDPCAAEK